MKERVDVVQNMAIRYSPLKSLNDPFESLPLVGIDREIDEVLDKANVDLDKYWDELDEKTEEAKIEFEAAKIQIADSAAKAADPHLVGDELVSHFGDAFGVLCFSRTNRNLLMWSHYTDNGKGYVLAFDDQHSFFHKNGMDGNPTRPQPVVYSTVRQIIDVKDKLYYEKLLCSKSMDWAYEEEERIFTSFAPSCDVVGVDGYGQKIILSDIPSDAVSAVYIGYNASKETEMALLTSASINFNECPVYRARISPTEYRVQFDQIESA